MRASLPLVLFLGCSFVSAQAIAHGTNTAGLVQTRVHGIDIPAISGAPFTATIVVTWVQPLVGGGTASRTYYTHVARDANGRVRQEFRSFIPLNSTAEPPLRTIIITDPIAATRTVCTPSEMTCNTAAFQAHTPLTDEAGMEAEAGTQLPTKQTNLSRVSLGQQSIDQLPVTGIHETASNVTGDGGASRVVVSHRDLWYSADLQIDLSVARDSPQLGLLTMNVTDLVRGDPDNSWFAIPSGYTSPGNSGN